MGETAIKSHLKGPKQAKNNIKVKIPETVDNHDASLYFEDHDVAKLRQDGH